jgi:hypothetical protein
LRRRALAELEEASCSGGDAARKNIGVTARDNVDVVAREDNRLRSGEFGVQFLRRIFSACEGFVGLLGLRISAALPDLVTGAAIH